MYRTATPACFRSAMTSKSRSVSRCVRLEVGSSMIRTRALQGQGAGDLDELLLADRQVADAGGRATRPGRRARASCGLRGPCRAGRAAGRPRVVLAAEEEVGGDAQVLRQVQLLVDQDDAPAQGVGHAGQAHLLASHRDGCRRPADRCRPGSSSAWTCRRRSRRRRPAPRRPGLAARRRPAPARRESCLRMPRASSRSEFMGAQCRGRRLRLRVH